MSMVESRYPNRWFGANPQSVASQGHKLTGWDTATPKDWRSALGVAAEDAPSDGPSAPTYSWSAPDPPHKRRTAIVAMIAIVIIGAIGWTIGNATSRGSSGPNLSAKVDPTLAQGGHDFVGFACAACHGMQGKGGPDPSVPVLASIGTSLSAAQLSSIINDGMGATANAAGGTNAPYMPTWRNILSAQQVSDLVAYIQAGLPAIAGAAPAPIPTGQGDVVAGSVLFYNYGCQNCHGANGLGGVVNPSPDGTIPPLGGTAFNTQFPTAQSVIDVITSGSIIGKNPITSMPHWGSIIPPAQMQQLVAYIRTLPGPSK